VGTVANFRAQKDYPNLLAAARLLADRRVPVRIVAVGQGPQEEETRALHAALGLGDRVILTGRRDDAVAVMAACDAFVMASNNEGLPVAIMEALALGLPVVSTAVGGIPEAITDGTDGILVPARDPEALATALTRIVEDPALRARLAAGAAAAGDRYDIRTTTARLEAIYREVLG
jgi:glycosyltransferase involved in cell wall biosynthesis